MSQAGGVIKATHSHAHSLFSQGECESFPQRLSFLSGELRQHLPFLPACSTVYGG